MLHDWKDQDSVMVRIFGEEKTLEIIATGDNQFDETGNYKERGFELTPEERNCLDWFLENVDIEDYRREITAYCNEVYEAIGGGTFAEEDLERGVGITGIAVNISEITQSGDGSLIYPEISFLGECECDPEHGICIGFRDKKFLGINAQGWTL